MQGADKDPFDVRRRATVARTGAAKAAGIAQVLPVGGAIECAVEVTRIDKGLQQQQWVAEARLPVPCQAAFAQGEDPRGEVRDMVFWQDQKATIVGDEVQAIVLVAKIPSDPGIPCRALPGRGREAQQCPPLAAPEGDIPEGVADLRQGSQVVMGVHQGLEARLLVGRNGLYSNVLEVQAPTLAPSDVEMRYTRLAGRCPKSGATACGYHEILLERFCPGRVTG